MIVFNSIKSSVTFAYFEIDPVGFIENLCENTDKPELQCDGKCQLKKVAQSQDKKQNTPESILDFKELILFSSIYESIVFHHKESFKKENPTIYQNLYSFNRINDCFHPPQV
ncbi:hypothetical protein [Algibacter sp.]|uniref:hypothetical protein n=1 Tax=Algibacter sp. TaxID=1872428 RepID=UPI003C7730F3